MATLDPQTIVDQMTLMQRLIYNVADWGRVKISRLQSEILSMRVKAYNDELTIQAQHSGCAGRAGRLTNADITERLSQDSQRDAESIANTHSYFLAVEILRVGETPTGLVRRVLPVLRVPEYAKAVKAWSESYWSFKKPQITMMTDNSARAKAQQDFYIQNRGVAGTAKLEPTTAVCPICQGWIARGIVPLRVALNNPPPYHQNCPHIFSTRPDKVSAEDCPLLWMGS